MYKRCRMKQGRRQQCNKMYNMGYREFLEYTATEESNLSLATMVIGTRRERVVPICGREGKEPGQ
jgi:hypothetical protein